MSAGEDLVDHINLLKVYFSSQIAVTPPFFSAMCALSAALTGFVFISLVCCFCSNLGEVARAKREVFTAKSVTYSKSEGGKEVYDGPTDHPQYQAVHQILGYPKWTH
jgi:hypothetical protein